MLEIMKLAFLCGIWSMVECVFFHEPSAVVFKPHTGENYDFGFSMGFQNGPNANLVVSAPTETFIGKIYTCPLTSVDNINCSALDINMKYQREPINPNQRFYLGASIAATSDYFVTCAPLWVGQVRRSQSDAIQIGHGFCFVYNNGTVSSIHTTSNFPSSYYQGGVGWNTLVDEKRILIAKPAYDWAITYINKTRPLSKAKIVKDQAKKFMDAGYGLASGNFFNKHNIIAFSTQESYMMGRIYFLEEKQSNSQVLVLSNTFLHNGAIGSMFGYAMSAADINKDGLSDLIVGAPAFKDEIDRPELGAIHIYIGGSLINKLKNMRTIVGSVENGRFGMTITTGDIDGDEISEIFVSAPYENLGDGAVYVLSGDELKKVLCQTSEFMQIPLSYLKKTQKIHMKNFKKLGFSLQFVKDVDENGFNELAIGSPGTGSVVLYRSIHTVKVSISLELKGSKNLQIIGDPDSFTVIVCILIGYKSKNVPGTIIVNYDVTGGDVKIDSTRFMINLLEGKEKVCENIEVTIKGNPPRTYNFNTALEILDQTEKLKNKDFTKTTAVFRPDSETEKGIPITVYCKGVECQPKLSLMTPHWSGGSKYKVGSTETETVSIKVRNDGHSVNGACVSVDLKGASILKAPDCKLKEDGRYDCSLLTLRRNVEKSIDLTLDMTNITNLNRELNVTFSLYEVCERKFIVKQKLSEEYLIDTGAINVVSENRDIHITDTEMAKEETESFSVNQVYLIENSGNIRWLNLSALIEIDTAEFNFTANVAITETDVCSKMDNADKIIFNCTLSVEKKSFTKVIVGVNIAKDDFGHFIADGKTETKIESKLLLALGVNDVHINSSSESIVAYKKERSFGNNYYLMIVIFTILALLLLGVLCYVLYRNGFFQGENKKKLDQARATVRRKSMKQSTTSQENQGAPAGDHSNTDIEILDSVFEDTTAGCSSKDDNKLIEEKPHC